MAKIIPILEWERLSRLPVTDLGNPELLYWVNDEQARDLVASGHAQYLRTKKKIRGVELLPAGEQKTGLAIVKTVKPTKLRAPGLGDSHKSERKDNPPGVWTIDRIPRNKHSLFTQVVHDCLKRAA